jgi:hypothetical protein
MQNTIIRQQILKIIGTQPQLVEQANQMLAAVEQDEDFDLEGIDEFIAALESTLTAPESYPQVLQMLIAEDLVDDGDLPEQFDRGMIISLLAALYTLESRVQSKPQGFSRGGLAEAAKEIQSKGRDGDTILAHINPQEARLLKAAGGSGTINPETGLPEFKKFKSVLKKLIKVALPIALAVFAPGIGTAIGSAIGLTGTAASVAGSALLQGTISKATGGDFLQGAIGGAIGGGLGGVAGSTANSALGLGLGATGQQILGGAIGGGLQGAATGGNILQGALGGALGSGLGNLAGAGLNETLGLGLGDAGTRMLGSGLSGAAMSSLSGGDALSGGLEGALGGFQTDNPFASALSGAAQSKLMGGDVAQGAIQGGFAGLANKYREEFKKPEATGLASLTSSFLPGYKTSKPGEDQQYIPFGPPQSMQGFDPNTAGLMNMDVSASPGAAAQTMKRFAPLPKGTFNVAPANQVDVFKKAGTAGTLGGQAMNLPVYDVGTGPSFVQRFIDQAQSGGYMNPQWSTYRPGVQLMASGPPSVLGVDGGATAYVPNISYPRAADSVMLATNKQFTPQSAASVLSHELYHTKQPAGTTAYQGSRSGLQDFQQNLTNVLPHLQSTYGYSGAYDNMPLNKVPLNERMADLQSFQFNQGIDFAKDPVFQQKVLKDPYARAAYNASTIERTTRLDPRDLPPGVVTSSDFGPGGPPLMWTIENKIKNMLPAPRRFAKGGLAEVADMSRPFVGYRSAGRRPESQQDRRAAADAPLAALRGMVSGALGAPGDIESLVRMLPGLNEQTVLPTSEDVRGRLPGRSLESTPVGRAATELGTLGGGFYVGPGSPLRAIAGLPSAVSRAGRDFAMAAGQPTANVIKPKGGNWLAGSVEGTLKNLKRPDRMTGGRKDPSESLAEMMAKYTPESIEELPLELRGTVRTAIQELEKKVALNNWVDRNLTNYVKKEMATPEDPVRRLAEEGITHMPQGEIDFANQFMPEQLAVKRMMAGFDPGDAGVSNAAKGWERITDEMINVGTAGQHTRPLTPTEIRQGYKSTVDDNPWLTKLDPSTPVYYPENMDSMSRDLGFDHILDVLREDLASGRIRPEQLNKVSMEQAVRRTYEYDQELAAKINAARAAQREGLPVYKEYPEGYRWVELNKPGAFASESEAMGHSVRGYEPPQGHPDWVEGSGGAGSLGYGHGGWEAIKSGKAKVYSLVDSKGSPHVTVEVGRPELKFGMTAGDIDPYRDRLREQFPGMNEEKLYYMAVDDFTKDQTANIPPRITQIKGKGNARPKDEYLPFVQDFVKSGQWSDVGDIRNTGLVRRMDLPFNEKNLFPEGSDYITEQELRNLRNPNPAADDGGAVHMAAGGLAKLAKLVRAPAKSKEEISALAERLAPQVTGEYVRKDAKSAKTVADKTQKQFQREKTLSVDVRPTSAERIADLMDIERIKGNVMIGIPGDPTLTGKTLYSVGDVKLGSPSPQHGGPQYGLYNDEDKFWASGIGAARRVQNLAKEAGEQYDANVAGNYIMMGPESINYAQHFADANLQAIDLSKMTKKQVEQFNKLIRFGSPESGPRPFFPGIQDKEEAYLQMAMDPALRKHFNALMQQPTVTETLNLPSGTDIRFAITEPSLRDLETGVTGFSMGRMRPEISAKDLELSLHPTYSHDIPGEFLGQSKYPMPYELSFPDTLKMIREDPKQAPHEFGSLKMVGPRQIIDQQMIDEIKSYEERMKALTGKKAGGIVRGYAAGGMVSDANFPTDDFDPDRIDSIVAELHAMNVG